MQHYTSANTSVNSARLPKTFTQVKDWTPGYVNLDYGGGRFDNATEFLSSLGVTNLVYDPYNRSPEHNQAVLEKIAKNKADTVTCNNVLNVIDCDRAMEDVVNKCALYLKPDGTAFFKIYEGDRSGVSGMTKADCYQRNWKTARYIPIVEKYFKIVSVRGDIITASGPVDGDA